MLTAHPTAGLQKRDLHVGGLGASPGGALAAVTGNVAGAADSWFEKARIALRETDDYVHANPWHALALVAVAGLTAGYWLSRRT
jgi:ElaB/YqjD/DUF883 family membrane-anchored ribosome-binding protein